MKQNFKYTLSVFTLMAITFLSVTNVRSLFSEEKSSSEKSKVNSRALPNSEIKINEKDASEISKWVPLPERQLKTRLKAYAFAKVRTSLLSKLTFTKEKLYQYSQCPEMFPSMPGDFPCSLLNYDGSSSLPVKDPSLEYKAGGTIAIWESDKKIPLIGGIALQIGASSVQNETNPDSIIAYYDPNGLISHYRFKERVIVFNWTNENKEPTLKSLISVELNSENWVKSGEEIDYSK